ncbi:class I SAM-dependent methyltransferase [Streptomyces sp. NPDC052396]|uniref:class I SAM-dependent methyltransferase n=1 Tax=Streptomyces sp. NPDC052396 TaxID=3365689 RepID=UPI0037D47581
MTSRHDHDTAGYWETTGAACTFTHEPDPGLLARWLDPGDRILDYGCGYGRLLARLTELGYRDVQGVEPSAALIARAARSHPGLRITRLTSLPLPFPDGSFDAALLFAVLTSVADPAAREETMAELSRLLRPGGVLYLSDVPLQSDELSLDRYRRAAAGPYGTFRTEDGGVFVHQPPEAFQELLARHGFTELVRQQDTTPALHGGTTTRVQFIARRREG